VRTAVESGNAATATSELVAARGLSLGTLHKVGIELPVRAFHVLRHRQRYRSKAAEALLDLISDTTNGKG
jgi:DNA-binding transcriptional LysR family regulator